MNFEKKIKKQLIEEASLNPEKYFPTKTLKKFGMQRKKCQNCQIMFWSIEERDLCGDINCVKQYSFIENSPCKNKLEFQEIYFKFSKMFQKEGYTPIKRFPVVARWRDDLDFNIASIIGFQPYVVKGEVEPPANPLTIPQICLRFSDIDNVGYTGRHHTGFTMIGQHSFQKPENYKQEDYFKILFNWYLEGLGIDIKELTVHEDAWAGGGNCGPSLEIFVRGLELGNQVYMIYNMEGVDDITKLKELNLKVLDMGMGQERCCWISKGSVNSYEATMPKICKYLFKKSNFKPDMKIYNKFLPYSGMLNLDEIDDINIVWKDIANKININLIELREKIEPIAGIYSIADHTRTLLYALSDGALPSNVKGGYNLRLILRRALDFIYKFKWNINLFEIIKLQAKELNKLYPELEDNLNDIKKIIDIEIKKYYIHKEKVGNKIKNLLKKETQLTNEEFIKFYISEGITPEEIKDEFKKNNQRIIIPENFFTLVNEFFENRKNKDKLIQENKFEKYLENIQKTELLFYKNSYKRNLDVKILKIFEHENKKYIILDKTLFYPTMGGQEHDTGFIEHFEVINVIKIRDIILHEIK